MSRVCVFLGVVLCLIATVLAQSSSSSTGGVVLSLSSSADESSSALNVAASSSASLSSLSAAISSSAILSSSTGNVVITPASSSSTGNVVIPPASSSSSVIDAISSSSSSGFAIEPSSSSSLGNTDGSNWFYSCDYFLFPNATTFTVVQNNDTVSPKFMIWTSDDSSNANSMQNALTAPIIYLQRNNTYFFSSNNQTISFAIGQQDPVAVGGVVLNPVGLTTPNEESTFRWIADPSGSGVTRFFYGAYYSPNEVVSAINMGQQIFVADNTDLNCPESSTGQSILFPDEDHLPGDNAAPAVVTACGVTLLTVLAAVVLTF